MTSREWEQAIVKMMTTDGFSHIPYDGESNESAFIKVLNYIIWLRALAGKEFI